MLRSRHRRILLATEPGRQSGRGWEISKSILICGYRKMTVRVSHLSETKTISPRRCTEEISNGSAASHRYGGFDRFEPRVGCVANALV